MRRLPSAAACFTCLLALGCVEGQQTVTLNPDGSGKVRVDLVMVPPVEPFQTQPKDKKDTKSKDASLDQMLAEHLKTILPSPGVDAWRDVSASFAPDGRLKFAGTAYFKKCEDFSVGNIPFLGSSGYGLTAQPDGSLVFGRKKKDGGGPLAEFQQGERTDKTPEEIAKMTDAQLDEYIMKDRVGYQKARRLLALLLADAKVKWVYVLPGEPAGVRGYKPEGRGLAFTFDGNKVLAAVNDVYAKDAAGLRAFYRSRKSADSVIAGALGLQTDEDLSATVPKPTGPQFDYDKEVKEARAAYPELRKTLKLPPDVQLPGEPPPPDKK